MLKFATFKKLDGFGSHPNNQRRDLIETDMLKQACSTKRTFTRLHAPHDPVEIQPETHYKRLMTAAPSVNVTFYRVIYGDTDQMGVVYYANYLRWFEKGRTEYLRQIGLPYSDIEQQGFNFPVVEVSCRYLQSARYDDEVCIETQMVELGRASLSFHYRITRNADDSLLATGSTKHACLDRNGRPTRMPKTLQEAIDHVAC